MVLSVETNVVAGRSVVDPAFFLSARRYATAGTSYGPVSICLSVSLFVSDCLSKVGVLSKRMDGSIWFLARRLLAISPTLRKFRYVQK